MKKQIIPLIKRPGSIPPLSDCQAFIPERSKKCINDGFLTLEAALLMPVIFFTILSVLYLNFHVLSSCCLNAGACETAITGRDTAIFLTYGCTEAERNLEDTKKYRRVQLKAETIFCTGEIFGRIERKACYKKCRPVQFLRKKQYLTKELTY